LTLWGAVQTDYKLPIAVTEGSKQLVSHFRRERSAKLISTKKKVFVQRNGNLFCEICGFSFEETYPTKLGLGYMEAHHKVPLSKIDSLVRTTLDDLLLVCSNCHRMIHRTKECEENLENLFAHFNRK
jgi:5-methylcytosine-specific restriction enzyme A